MGTVRKIVGIAATTAALGTAGAIAAPAASAEIAPCSAAADACIQLGINAAWVMDNGNTTYGAVPITSGKPGYETPTGTFQVTFKDADYWSQAYDAPMPNAVFFTTSGIAFHEGSLDVLSHGCIHLSPEASVEFFNGLEPGDTVEVVA
ncbi:hypothetical protein CFN78_20180 [Amycolatopsis antarctica]|uniref:L,D-TPase catalytic domain-containing protein n=1 Tax=Amycolatopsis antarctica TaxID=1854586 RepID=A0A263D287_9PSEU|nr:L,D-transpeptidase [Amycolatopsis antarctica]OZM71465.1 hypothetical protein CFN78_20180 [Amycolatopsis antarctica]